MRKLLAILLCLSLIFAIATYSKPKSQTQQPAQAENQPEQTDQAEQPSKLEAPAYPIEQFTVGTTAVIETTDVRRVQLRYARRRCERTAARLAGRGGHLCLWYELRKAFTR